MDGHPLELVAIIRCLDEDGREIPCVRQTEGMGLYECIGLLRVVEQQMHGEVWEDE